ncbi:hypothetical protein A3B60_03890 [Candidatus Peregrinibacteria bacterium RIFCSPLOWO2_01_FULL_39_12]|nr:MAG: hypothetical protein A3B60_03890 [Candidatus Peregrinibacteria bacterium RIFCSPLOWO2_01_FULL_39_12]
MSIEGGNEAVGCGGSEGREAADLVDIVVNGRTSRRGLLGAVALAVASGCAARVKSVVGGGGASYPDGSLLSSSSPSAVPGEVRGDQKEQSSEEICRKDNGELEVPLDVVVRDLPLESRRILAKIKLDEAKADGMVDEAAATSKYYENIDTVKRMVNIRYETYLEFRNRATYDALLGEVYSVYNMMVELEKAREKLAEAGYMYAVIVAGLLRMVVPKDDAGFVELFKRSRKRKLCDLRGKVANVHVISGSIDVSYSQLEDLVPEDFSDIPEVLHED